MLMAIIRAPRWFFRATVGVVTAIMAWLTSAVQSAFGDVSVSFSGGTLNVSSNSESDTISVTASGGDLYVYWWSPTLQSTVYSGQADDLLTVIASGGDGHDSIKIDLSNGSGTNCTFVDVNGGNGNDTMHGSSLTGITENVGDGGGADGNDCVLGWAGADNMFGEAGHDTIIGGDGADTINGGAGNDAIYGEAGNDLCYGDANDDRFEGGLGADTMYGGSGIDGLYHNTYAAGTSQDGVPDDLWGNELNTSPDSGDFYLASPADDDVVDGVPQ